MTYDLEAILDNTKQILIDNLNTEIILINSEKPDAAVMGIVDDNAYCFQSLDDSVHNFDPVILYGVVDIATENNGPANIDTVTISIAIIATDDTDGNNMTRRMFRYQKALKRTLEKNWHRGGIANKINIKSLLPARITDLNSSNEHRVVGIEFETIIT